MSRPTGQLRIWSFGYAMCTRPVNRCVSAMACSTSLIARATNSPPCWRQVSVTACASSSTMQARYFQLGHKVRLAISTAYWPMIWPSPETATVQIFSGTLDLPQRSPNVADAKLSPFPEPETASPEKPTIFHRDGVRIERIDRIGLELGTQWKSQYHVEENDPLSAVAELRNTQTLSRNEWQIRVETQMRLSSTRNAFLLQGSLRAFEGATKCVVATGIVLFARDFS